MSAAASPKVTSAPGYVLRQIGLAVALIAVPVVGFTLVELTLPPHAPSPTASLAQPAPLGDLSAMSAIVLDVVDIIDTGDLGAAEKRATDLETAWDDAEPTLRPMNEAAWGNIDRAADALFHALRQKALDAAKAKSAGVALLAALAAPLASEGASNGKGVVMVSGIAVTDANGHALPCEDLVGKLRTAIGSGSASANLVGKAQDALGKAMERCNADDDTRSNAFSAAGLALLTTQLKP